MPFPPHIHIWVGIYKHEWKYAWHLRSQIVVNQMRAWWIFTPKYLHWMLFNLWKNKFVMQNELLISIQQRKLGEPTTDTIFGKTVSILCLENKKYAWALATFGYCFFYVRTLLFTMVLYENSCIHWLKWILIYYCYKIHT